jgi:hypothetical protein
MDPTELIKAASEIAKGVAAVGAAILFTGIVKPFVEPCRGPKLISEVWLQKCDSEC